MSNAIPLMTETESRRSVAADDRAGFGALETVRGRLPLRALDVHATIDGLLYELSVQQTFLNTTAEPLEATYVFPLPDRAAVTSFRLEVGGRLIEGVLEERGQARREYDAAIQAGQRAAIAEEERPDVFTLRVGNLMPGEPAATRLVLVGPLAISDGEATFQFPLVVAPRYIPGVALSCDSAGDGTVLDTDAVPDASRITPPVLLPGFPNPVQLGVEVELRPSGLAVRDVRSSLHAVRTEADDRGGYRIRVQPGERLDRDFILRFRVSDAAIQTAFVVTPDEASAAEGTFGLVLVPPAAAAAGQRPRDVVFVLDRSGSMRGWKIIAARRAVARMVDTLNDADRFSVYAFDDTVETPAAFGGLELVSATDRHRFRAVEFLSSIDARGGTEMALPIKQAVQRLSVSERDRDCVLVLITDGQVGNEDQILRKLGGPIRSLRIFTLGIDRAVNAGFLRRLAILGGGLCEFVESEDRLDEVMDKVHRRLGSPVLTNLSIEPGEWTIERDSVVPQRLPDLFAGAPLQILGRYRGTCDGSITITAHDAGGRAWSQSLPACRAATAASARVWARGHLRDLEDRYAVADGERERLEKQIVGTSLKFSVLCRFTAFVAVDRSAAVNQGGKLHRIVQPVSYPQGWEMPLAAGAPLLASCVALRAFASVEAFESVDSMLQEFEEAPPSAAGKSGPSRPAAGQPLQQRQKRKSQRLMDRLLGRSDDESGTAIDLAAYRHRAADLLDRLRETAGDKAARLTALAVWAEQLARLVEDLESVGAPAAAIASLSDLLRSLRKLLSEPERGVAEFERLKSHAEELLESFVNASPTPMGIASPCSKHRESFWK